MYYFEMSLTGKWWLRLLLLLITFHSSLITSLAAPLVLPELQASHFCRLLVSDGQTVMPLSSHVRRVVQPSDSLTREQIFVGFLLDDDNWLSLRFFPHCQADGSVAWYAPGDDLPASLGSEHQKYIREVFPRLIAEVQAGRWDAVDAYIDRMLQYQCQFGGTPQAPRPSSYTLVGIFLAASVLVVPFTLHPSSFTLHKPNSHRHRWR